ncbi:hypothetical protein MKW94_012597 [Papaver nudicaule]|uniref:Uncharacterized protein n=1 Tax=Papaver nudicaule TaxID=74823 RepID=A0AA41RQH6_PAPNU|nr:hypothetical protein [Papaver nudicaule]
MFWGQNERENSEPTTNDDLHCGQIRVLVVGDSGVGKTSLVHLIDKGSRIRRPSPTVGCTVTVKHTSYGGSGSSSNNSRGDTERGFFVELWDVSGHERYKECRSLFYSQINEARYDKEAVLKFFNLLIKRRYFADELQAPSPWSVTPSQRPPHNLDHYNNTPSLYGDPYIPNIVPRIPSQRNLTPSSALFPQQPPVSASEINSYNLPRFCSTGSLADSNTRLKF